MGLDSTGSSPVFPIMITNKRSYFLNQLKLGSTNRKFFLDAEITTDVKPLANLLQDLNVIRRFYKLNREKNIYRVYPTYSKFRYSSRTITTYARVRGRIRLTVHSLRLLDINAVHSHFIIETSRGVMTQKDAIRQNLGGLLLLIID